MNALDHRQADELLPWLVNATLVGEEASRVERHVAACVTCRRRFAELQLLAEAVAAERVTTIGAGPSLAALRERLAAGGAVGAARRGRRRWLLTAAAIVIAVIGATLWTEREPAFRTLGTAGAEAGAGPQLRVLFAENASEREIRGLLHDIEGEIVAGPTPLGLFTVEVPRGTEVAPILEGLRAHPRVRFVEIVRGGELE